MILKKTNRTKLSFIQCTVGGVGEENKWEAGNKQSSPPLVGVKGKVCKIVQELDAGSQLVHVIMMVII